MERKFIIFLIAFLVIFILVVQALAQNFKLGLPEEIRNYRSWLKVNKNALVPNPSTGHPGYKDVYINKLKEEILDSEENYLLPFEEEIVIVKESRKKQTRSKRSIQELTTMRKTNINQETGNWEFKMFTKMGRSFREVEINPITNCFSCHQRAQNTDFVFTKFDNQ